MVSNGYNLNNGLYMKLYKGEETIFNFGPDKKILIPWFFTKTMKLSIAAILVVFSLFLFANSFLLVSNDRYQKEHAEHLGDKLNERIQINEHNVIKHPLLLITEYWHWLILLTFIFIVSIQSYLGYLRKTYKYIITNKRCIFVGGIFKRTERIVAYKKHIDIERTQNMLERLLGIWNVQIFTPGTSSVSVAQRKIHAKVNFDGLINSDEVIETIKRQTHK